MPRADYLERVFGAGGALAARLPGYRPRPGQRALAERIDAALAAGGHLLAEGPTGTGKSLAYAVPASYHAAKRGLRVVIATANIALQEQLAHKDLPLVQSLVPWRFRFGLLKGRGNYLCRHRLDTGAAVTEPWDDVAAEHHAAIVRWAARTETGDVSELPFAPSPAAWSTVSVGSDECLGKDCRYAAECFYERHRRAAHEAHIVVTNYHLLFAHIVVRQRLGVSRVLPDFDVAILDEAHEAADIARGFFGFSVTERGLGRAAAAAANVGLLEHVAPIETAARTLFAALGALAAPDRATRLATPGGIVATPTADALAALAAAASSRAEARADMPRDAAHYRACAATATSLERRVREAFEAQSPSKAYWLARDAKGRVRVEATCVDVGPLLRAELFGATRSVIAASATLSTAGSLAFIRRELGVPRDAGEIVVESPFDHARQARLVVPDAVAHPRDPAFPDDVARVLREVIERCGGRTLGLFTSHQALDAAAAALWDLPYPILRQGMAPRTQLVEMFRAEPATVLLGTTSFWTGVDVPGPSLSAVVIDKLPFPHPDDPVATALRERDPRSFATYVLPKMIMLLRQGVGRLLRSELDAGVVVLLDRRVLHTSYGARVLRSLPPMPRVASLAEAAAVLGATTGSPRQDVGSGRRPSHTEARHVSP